ncbi:hypothetical protein RVX_R01150 [Nitratidesulfovibrio sp. HK-II]|nr:hypothetical protein [Nitratidesulfovibrio sp. HK-II]
MHYDEVRREYYTKLRGNSAIQLFVYCPWCGVKLPTPLGSVYYGTLREMFGDDVDIKDMDIPEEFKTDAWWRNSKVDLEALAEKYEKEWEEEVSLIQIAGA